MANQDIVFNWGQVNRSLPGAQNDNTYGPMRVSRRGELVTADSILKARHIAADEGTYFFAHNATNDAATTLAGHAAPVLVDADATMTKPILHLRMPSSVGNIRAYLDFVEIEIITAGANGTADSWAAQLDTGATRVSSGGTAMTALNPNMQSSAAAALVLLGGAVVTGAETANVRDLGFGQFRPTIQIAGDKYMFVFGGAPETIGATSVATITHHVVGLPPVILGATDQLLLALYSPSQSAASVVKMRCGWIER
jgi:hypothetical protein